MPLARGNAAIAIDCPRHAKRTRLPLLADRRTTSLWMPLNSEAEQGLLRVVVRVVFHKPVLHRRVNAVARYREFFTIVADLKYVVIKRVRAVEVSGLTQCVGVRVPETLNMVQTRITRQTDRFNVRGNLRVRDAIRESLDQRETVI